MTISDHWIETVADDPDGCRPLGGIMFRTLFDAIPSSILVVDGRLRIVMANRNFLRKGNRTDAETLGRRFEEVFPAAIVERTDILECVQRVFVSNEQSPFRRITFRAPGMPMRTYYFRALPLPAKGRVAHAMFLMEDITEQERLSKDIQRVERHLASVVESASDILVSTDTGGQILSWNRAAERLTGYTAGFVMHRGFSELFLETERSEVEMALSRATALPGSLSEEWTLSTASGEGIAVSWTIAPMLSEDGTMIGMVAAGRDLTERYRMQSELLQSQKLAALGVMAGGIAHEIRNPLAVCSSAAQFLLDDSLEPELQRECVEKTIAGVSKASEIIENLLRFARPCAVEKMTLAEPVVLLEQALSVVSHQAQIARIEVEMQVGDRPLWVRGVPSLLEQAFLNLFLNAIAAMPAGGQLTIEVDQEGEEVSVHISDTGIGIHSADILRIFDPFYTRSPIGQGTGLGLSICYSIIQQHRGRIDVESEVGSGTCFCVRLPLAEPPCLGEGGVHSCRE
jgi:PAS domain S-box-containing protein